MAWCRTQFAFDSCPASVKLTSVSVFVESIYDVCLGNNMYLGDVGILESAMIWLNQIITYFVQIKKKRDDQFSLHPLPFPFSFFLRPFFSSYPPKPNPLSRLHYFRPSLVSLLFPSTPIVSIRFLYFPFFFPSLLFFFSIPPYLFPFTPFFSFSFVLFPFPPIPVFPSLYLPFSHFLVRFYVVVYSFAATYAFLSSLHPMVSA